GVQPENIARMSHLLLARREAGAAFVIVEQNLSFLLQVADAVLVLDHGERVASGAMSAFTRDKLESHLVV
ncbi:MAG: urea ABC transporter ATP-binding protein, partial [Burkholderiales bacterium]|nr:urea ABC transporter ATP-binding protein [Burkholderiales bacterium]